jgi:hypothetical protein
VTPRENRGMAEATFYVYQHREADTGKVFYVGKGSGARARSTQWRPAFWHRVAQKHGLLIEIVAMFWSEADAFAFERDLIAECRRDGARLTNCTDGGEGAAGAVRSDETRNKIAQAKRGRKRPPETDETRARKRASAIGRRMSAEAIAKTAASRIGKKLSDETVAKIKETLKGRRTRGPQTPAEIERLRNLNLGKKRSEESIAKQSAAMQGKNKGVQKTPEHRERIAESNRRTWAAKQAAREALT